MTTNGLVDDWQAKAKRIFIVPLILVNVALIVAGFIAGWWGVSLAASGQILLFALIGLKLGRSLPAAPAFVPALAGLAVAATQGAGAIVLALVAVAMLLAYVFWYSPNRRTKSAALAVDSPLPELHFVDLEGTAVSSADWSGTPTILLFYRGLWCPLCNTQVQELSDGYREIESLGAQVVLVSPQPAKESSKMATRFDAPMTFLVDEGNRAAIQLGIQHPGGAPIGVAPETETVLPTAVVLDADGVVRFAHETDNYRFRPDPALFLDALRGLTPTPG